MASTKEKGPAKEAPPPASAPASTTEIKSPGGDEKPAKPSSKTSVGGGGGDKGGEGKEGDQPLEESSTTKEGKKDKCNACMKFLYNSQTGEVIGRGGLSWLKIFIFYIIFYTMLGSFFVLMLCIALISMPSDAPKYLANDSLIGGEPGVSYLPMMKYGGEISYVFDFRIGENLNEQKDDPLPMAKLADQIKNYIDYAKTKGRLGCGTRKSPKDGNKTDEEFFMIRPRADKKDGSKKPCRVDPDLGPCSTHPYGWIPNADPFEPCVLIKLNRVWGWTPPQEAPPFPNISNKSPWIKAEKEMAERSVAEADTNASDEGKRDVQSGVRIFCYVKKEETHKLNLVKIKGYYPYAGIPAYYFPFLGQKTFVSPYIMVQFSFTRERNDDIEIVCTSTMDATIPPNENAKLTKFMFRLHRKSKK